MGTDNVVVRRAVGADAGAVAEVWLRSFTAALPGVRRAHTDDQVRSWFREVVVSGLGSISIRPGRAEASAAVLWTYLNEEGEPDIRYVWRPGSWEL